MADITEADWTYEKAAHLLRRAGFSHNGTYRKSAGEASQVRSLANKTPEQAVDKLLAFSPSRATGPSRRDTSIQYWDKLRVWWLQRMIQSPNPVREKIVLFLHTHFATARSKVNQSAFMALQNSLFREFAGGDFRELVKRINVDPAMLWWLDGQSNKRGAPNENYGRELQELFTLGVYDFAGQRNYAEADVREAARVLTGWRIRADTDGISPYFTLSRHDVGAKSVFAPDLLETPGQNPANRYDEPANALDEALAVGEHRRLVDAIFGHRDTEGRPTAARHLVRRAWRFFAYDPVVDAGTSRADLDLIDDLADVFVASGYNLKALLRAMFLRTEFYADPTRTVKSPVEFVVGAVRELRGKLTGDFKVAVASSRTGEMGQELFNPPDVFSWKGNEAWITSQSLISRYRFARDLTQNDKSAAKQIGMNPYSFLDLGETTRAAVVDRFLRLLGPLDIDPAAHAELVNWLGATDPIDLTDANFVNQNVRGLIHQILNLPHYHVL